MTTWTATSSVITGTSGMIATNALIMIIAVMMFTNTGASVRRLPTPFS